MDSLLVPGRKNEGLSPILGPFSLIVKVAGIPINLFSSETVSFSSWWELRKEGAHTSSITCGILTGWLSGQVPLTIEKDGGPPIG